MEEFDYMETAVEETEAVGTVDVQILLSWFFETASPAELPFELPEAA